MLEIPGVKRIAKTGHEKSRPYEKHHSTIKDICSMAEKLNIKKLMFMHTEDSHIQNRKIYI
ncbi:MAG: hypothetical protein K1W24_06180 [Lachnospiraceae bacterium]